MRANGVFWRTSPGSTRSDSTLIAPASTFAYRARSSPTWSTPFSSGTTTASPTRSGGASASAESRSGAFGVTQSTSTSRSRDACDRDLDLEVAEDDALDTEPAGMPRERLRPEHEDDVRARASERAADQTPHAARAEDRVTHRQPKQR